MSGDFLRYALERTIAKAVDAGVPAAHGLHAATFCGGVGSYAAAKWTADHPDEAERDAHSYCCQSAAMSGSPESCTCWVPVYAEDQADIRPPERPEDLTARPSMCGDCAFRPDSPERAEPWTAEALYDSARAGTPFWCHDGMRRPLRWQHPDGRVVDGSPHDWQPPIVGGVPYRADGRPALLCAGWRAVASAADAEATAAVADELNEEGHPRDE